MKLKEKENLVQKIGMKFDEAVELFSDETLESMVMNNILGGSNAEYCIQNGCAKDSSDNLKTCTQNGCGGGSSSGSTGSTGSKNPNITAWITAGTAVVTAIIGLFK